MKNILPYRYFIECSFRGTNYHGWQIQPNALTIQSLVNKSFSVLLREQIRTTGAGRTDSGVHAISFFAHFDSERKDLESDAGLLYKLNRILPEDIAIKRIIAVHPRAHSRYDAVSRTYIYRISGEKDPFSTDLAWHLHCRLDIDSMNQASSLLKEYSDFTSFCRLHSSAKTPVCEIMHAEWEVKGSFLVFTVRADRFLRNMVRALTGTLVDLGSGKISIEDLRKIIEKRDRSAAGKSAPAKGLFLKSVEYPEGYFNIK